VLSKTKSARLKKRRTLMDESRVLPPLSPMPPFPPPPVPAVVVGSVQRPVSIPNTKTRNPKPSSSPKIRSKSMWLNGSDHVDEGIQENTQPARSRRTKLRSQHSLQPTSTSSATSTLQRHARPRTPASMSTCIDEQEFLDLADFTYVSPRILSPIELEPVPPTRRPSRRSKRGSVATSISVYSQQSLPHDLQAEESFVDLTTDEAPFSYVDPPEAVFRVLEVCPPPIDGDRRSIASVSTIVAPKPRPASANTLADWVGYDSDTQSLRTIPSDDASEFNVRPPLRPFAHSHVDSGYYGSGSSTPTMAGFRSSATSTARPTPPMTPTTLVASRFSGFSQDTQITPKPKLKAKHKQHSTQRRRAKTKRGSRCSSPSPSHTLSFIPNSPSARFDREFFPISSKCSILDETICIDYDYGVAVDVLIYGASHSPQNAITLRSISEGSQGYKTPLASPLSATYPDSIRSKTGSRRSSVKIPVSARKKKGRRKSVILEAKVKQKRSLFAQVSHLFRKAG